MKTLYFSVRAVEAKNYNKACDCVENEKFYEVHQLCDKLMTIEELKEELSKL